MIPQIFNNPGLMNALSQTMRQLPSPSPFVAPTAPMAPMAPEVSPDMQMLALSGNRDRLMQDMTSTVPNYDDGSVRPGALGALAIASLIMNAIEKGSGEKFLQGYMGSRENQAATRNRKADQDVAVKRQKLNLEAQTIEDEMRRLELKQKIQQAFSERQEERAWDVEKMNREFAFRKDLESGKADAANDKALLQMYWRLSPQARMELAPMLGITPEAAGALTPDEKSKQATAANTSAKTRELEKTSDARLQKLLAEGDLVGARKVLVEAQTGFQRARISSENRKIFAAGSTRASMGVMSAADGANRTANDAVSGLMRKPPTSTSVFSAMSRLEDATTKAEASLRKLNVDLVSFESELAQIRAGKAKGIKPGTEEAEARELEKAISDTRALVSYYTTMRDRNVERMRKISQQMGMVPAMGIPEPVQASGAQGALIGAGPKGPIGGK